MILTEDNYYSLEADREYMSVSQYKDFAGCGGRAGCAFHAMEKLAGRWEDPPTLPLMMGSYVDRAFEGTLDSFKDEHPEMFTQSGILKQAYKNCDVMVSRAMRDELFMSAMSGEKQVIMTGELFGTKWKIKMDSYKPHKYIVDLKTVRAFRSESIRNPSDKWVRDEGYQKFYQYWGYDLQGAVYQEIVRQNTGERLPFYLAVISKEFPEPDISVGQLTQNELDDAMSLLKANISWVLAVKRGDIEPTRCGDCDCCRHHRVLNGPVWAWTW